MVSPWLLCLPGELTKLGIGTSIPAHIACLGHFLDLLLKLIRASFCRKTDNINFLFLCVLEGGWRKYPFVWTSICKNWWHFCHGPHEAWVHVDTDEGVGLGVGPTTWH